ncbi:XPC-binding domain-containing protein [Gigaspora rosea]|uniref:UV excision repair protein RAD23 n=1 Tax=Gigaspora rosea TaxID=44941 RepID=A0A397ULR3_9GLOM|nr:XPC-binding domain-containing protein [Gigaspora rosea]
MKITIKTLQQKQFHVEAEPEDTQKIEESQGHEVSLQKLIFSGKVLADDKSVSSYNITEKDFLVVMVSKPPSKPNVPPSSNSGPSSTITPQPNLTSSAPPPTVIHPPIVPITSPPSTQESEPGPTPTPAGSTPTNPQSIQSHFGNQSALVTGTDYTNAIQRIMELGFDRDQVVKAMRASFNNPDRAVEYLMTGIPESVQNEQIPATPDLAGNQPTPPTTGNTATPALPQNILQDAALAQQLQQQQQPPQQQQQQQQQGSAEEMAFLRSQPQFQQLRQLVQQNPAYLPHLLQQIGQTNPQLLQFINANQSTFTRLLQESGDDAGAGDANLPPPHYVSITQDEKDAIDRLEALGFDRARAIEAFLACDRNEDLAANYLFDNMHDDEN